ncbi:MAG: DAK2 domain-containing protein [Chloroflexi bacterium]|nr:DAK2 domain-containing protein [Chloroflexota bacterium]
MDQSTPAQTRPSPAASEKWLTCDGRQLRKLARAGLAWLEQNQHKVNALNVFPVPDGDTGTNMLLTMRAACNRLPGEEEKHAGRVAQELSQGALMGARGNSGVILSQVWRGMARVLKDKALFDADDLAVALQEAADTAYKGVMKPVEGTILTVIREGAVEAQEATNKSKDLRFVLERVLERCQQTLIRTPEMLPVLKQAGVVDAGGQGLVFIMEGMLRSMYGELVESIPEVEPADVPAQARAAPAEGLEFPYDVQFILLGDKLDVHKVRTTIDAMGDSTVVVGDEQMIKVHVHVKDPGVPLSYGTGLGRITDVVVENMQMQMEAIINPAVSPTTRPPAAVPKPEEPLIELQPGQIGVVAVAAGEGLARIFRSLGVTYIVSGGQSNNPSTEEIFQAIQDVPTNRVIVLPNNKNIILAAEAARDLSPKDVAVVPTRTVPQGISAMLSLDRDGELEEVAGEMARAYEHIASGEIAVATRSVVLDGVAVEQGQLIGIADGRLCAAGDNLGDILPPVLQDMALGERELLSIYYGQEASQTEAEELAERVQALYPGVEIELLPGDQPIYHYILGAE